MCVCIRYLWLHLLILLNVCVRVFLFLFAAIRHFVYVSVSIAFVTNFVYVVIVLIENTCRMLCSTGIYKQMSDVCVCVLYMYSCIFFIAYTINSFSYVLLFIVLKTTLFMIRRFFSSPFHSCL